MLYDVAAYQGPWPSGGLTAFSVPELLRVLRREGITRAALSPLGGIFQVDPMPVNRVFLREASRSQACEAVPVINPSLADWEDQLAECQHLAPQLKAVRLVPRYHGYRLGDARVSACIGGATARHLRIVLTARFVDRRLCMPVLRVDDFTVAELAKFLRRHGAIKPLITGLTLAEVRALARRRRNFLADIAFVEWLRSLETLCEAGLARHLLFSTNAPFFVPRANVAKLLTARLSDADREAIAIRNAERFFGTE